MFYIKLDDQNDLVITAREPIFRGDSLNHKIIFLIPHKVSELDTLASTIYLTYIRADETADVVLLERMEQDYNESYYQYTFPADCSMTRYPGELVMFLQVFSGPYNNPSISKSGECYLQVIASTNMDEYISDHNLSLIDQMQRYMDSKVEYTESILNKRIDKTDDVVASKADNIVFNAEDGTLQLVSTISVEDEYGNDMGVEQVPIGDPIIIHDGTARGLVGMEINESGNLIATFSDMSTQNLGRVVGKDGAVYIPHVDENKVLTFTIETVPAGATLQPMDMNPNDEWQDIAVDTRKKVDA